MNIRRHITPLLSLLAVLLTGVAQPAQGADAPRGPRTSQVNLGIGRTGTTPQAPHFRFSPTGKASPLSNLPGWERLCRAAQGGFAPSAQGAPRRAAIRPTFYAFVSESYDTRSSIFNSWVVQLNTHGTPSMTSVWDFKQIASPTSGAIFADGAIKLMEVTYTRGTDYETGNLVDGAFGIYKAFNMMNGSYAMPDFSYTLNNSWKLYPVAGMAQDPATGKIWSAFEATIGVPYLGTIVLPTDGNLPERGEESVPLTINFCQMFFGPASQLYGISDDGALYKINKETGSVELVGNTGVNFLLTDKDNFYGMAATYDAATDKAYWALEENLPNGGDSYTSRIYELNIATGQTTFLCDVPGNLRISALQVLYSEFDGEAPAQAENLSVSTNPQQTDVITVDFTIPTLTAEGGTLAGTVGYEVKADDELIGQGQSAPGAAVSISAEGIAAGVYTFSVVLSNDKGQGLPALLTQHVGSDQYKAPSNVKFTIDGLNAHITWKAATEAAHGGLLEGGEPTYRVVRQPDGKVVASGITATAADDQLDEHALANWFYEVYAYNGNVASEPGKSNSIKHGDYIVPPYVCAFEEVPETELFNVINANGDVLTWRFSTPLNAAQPGYWPYNAAYYFSYDGAVSEDSWEDEDGADDYLVSAPIYLQAGRFYNVQFSMRTGTFQQGYLRDEPESFECLLTDTPDPRVAQFSKRVASKSNFTTGLKLQFFDNDVEVENDGIYYLSWHITSDPEAGFLWLDDIELGTHIVNDDAPSAPTDVNVEPAPYGEHRVDISLTAPTTRVNGEALASIDSIEIVRNYDATIVVFRQPTPGQQLSYSDSDVEAGEYTYAISAYVGGEVGQRVVKSVMVGNDVPGPITSIYGEDNMDGQTMTFYLDEPTEVGFNGGYVDPSKVGLRVYALDSDGYLAGLVNSSTNGSQITMRNLNTDKGAGQVQQWLINRYNDYGTTPLYYTPPFFTGQPMTLPLIEHFSDVTNGYDNPAAWWITGSQRGGDVVYGEQSSDGDGHCISFTFNMSDDGASFNSHKLTLKGATRPVLSFDYFAFPGDNMFIDVYVNRSQQGAMPWELAGTVDISQLEGEIGWYTACVDLSPFVDEEYVVISLQIYVADAGLGAMLDNIAVYDRHLERDLSVSMTTGQQLFAGNEGKARITVSNTGSEPVAAGAYTLSLYAGERLVGTMVSVEALAGATATSVQRTVYEVPFQVLTTDAEETELRAVVEYEADMNVRDNTSAAVLRITKNGQAPCVTGLASRGAAELSWITPSEQGHIEGAYTDGFESYTPWTFNGFGGWTVSDEDHGDPRLGNYMAWTVLAENTLNYETTGQDPERWLAHTGSQYAVSMGNAMTDNSDWLVSPPLNGSAFRLSYYGMEPLEGFVPSEIEVCYSVTDAQPASFIPLVKHSFFNENRTEWLYREADIPEGARYFALHHVSGWGSWGVKVDDVTYPYFVGNVGPEDIVGFNVYADGRLLQRVSGDAATTGAALAAHDDAVQECRVSVLYALGGNTYESGLSQAVALPAGVTLAAADKGRLVTVFTTDGVPVARGAEGVFGTLRPGVYLLRDDVSGRTVKVVKR